jgi:dienelactone hydrolase
MKSATVFFSFLAILFYSCVDNRDAGQKDSKQDSSIVQIKEDTVSYVSDTTTFKGTVFFDSNREGKRPAVLVVHEWWGLNDYVRGRARELAAMGYLAMAVDMFGNGKTADNPADAGKLATPFYANPQLARTRLDAAYAKLKEYSQADTANVAAIGYCYGGFVVLNAAKLGADLNGVVSFHGGLGGAPVNKDLLKAKIFVAHGGADPFVPEAEVAAFKKGLDSIGTDYTFKVYPNATHAFTNPDATETGKKFNIPIAYNAAADSASWKDMKEFFGRIFNK